MVIPNIHARGRFQLKQPFHAKPEVIYEVTAIRELSDLYLAGIDVYKTYYLPAGLQNGIIINGEAFDYNKEVANNPMLITLQGSDKTVIYVPSTYISKAPDVNERLLYSRLVMTIDLGMLPDDLDLSHVIRETQELVSKRTGTNSVVKLAKAPASRQPDLDEHIKLENSRIGNIKLVDNTFSKMEKYKEENEHLRKQIATLTSLCKENGLFQ